MDQEQAESPYVPVETFYIPSPDGGRTEISQEEAIELQAIENDIQSQSISVEGIKKRDEIDLSVQEGLKEKLAKDKMVEETGIPAETIEFVLTGGKRTEEQKETNYIKRDPQSEDMDLSFMDELDLKNEAIGEKQAGELSDFVMENVLPDKMSEDEFEAYRAFAEKGELPDEFPEEMLDVFKGIHNAQRVAKSVHRRKSDKLAKEIGPTVEWEDARNIVEAHSEFYKSKRGWLETIGHEISIPQEILTRNAVFLLKKANMMTTEQAKDFLSHDSLYPSDLVNFYIDKGNTALSGVESFAERDEAGKVGVGEHIGRMFTSLASDVFLDPLTYMTGGLSAIGKIAKFAGKSKDVSKLVRFRSLR
jgi:hypothetical protein